MRTLILGGIASGKSHLALKLALSAPSPRIFVATAEATDPEMAEKIERHRRERGETFLTVEEPLELPEVLRRISGKTVVVDCLTVWLGNLLHYGKEPHEYFGSLYSAVKDFAGRLILVSNEIGLAPVAADALTRRYVNLLGELNRELSERCEEVLLVVAGQSLKLKPA
ncbi:bifunctional adenosylcobinamide kinase/adenosylcobinamide-phosphate guanylyltransferase [Thermosulfurimonas dismutans]|uniref:bifunctional adenosylcobinamide kinase/adenosylcobinamide-phosphate guanylyltransferase n=1 Tax=Thermosulfurimonas dismutans TaxID=999894 RepID=UPI000838BEDF|nr:bifunctional adenosylcobinamide kinase/adenosylcobinamide-phosphate guanylyltransferase [Thermosulfurimonas dismutans]